MTSKQYIPKHPGAGLSESLLFLGVTPEEFSSHLGIEKDLIVQIINEEAPITAEIALRLSAVFPGVSPESWLLDQAEYDIWKAQQYVDTSSISPYIKPLK